jgi:hypothetical protein
MDLQVSQKMLPNHISSSQFSQTGSSDVPLYIVALEGNTNIIISKYACCELQRF